RYPLQWLGNDGTFSAPADVSLPLDEEVPVPINVAPASAGVHSAILRVEDTDTAEVVCDVMAAIVAADELPKADRNLVLERETEWLRATQHYFRVPEGIGALTIQVDLQEGTQVLMTLVQPDGRQPQAKSSGNGKNLRLRLESPPAGVWELGVENGRSRHSG